MPIWMLLACAAAPEPRADTAVDIVYEAPALLINELLAMNDTVLADASGAYDDWLEIYNAGDTPVSLDGLYLNDYHSSFLLQAALPADRTIEPGAFLLVWCDDEPESTDAEVHVDFALDGNGLQGVSLVWLPAPGEEPLLVDTVVADANWTPNQSLFRLPDGGAYWTWKGMPSPGAANEAR